jgi:hypothetical protein
VKLKKPAPKAAPVKTKSNSALDNSVVAVKDLKQTGITLHYGNMPVWRAEIIRLPLFFGHLDYVDKSYEPYYGPQMLAEA